MKRRQQHLQQSPPSQRRLRQQQQRVTQTEPLVFCGCRWWVLPLLMVIVGIVVGHYVASVWIIPAMNDSHELQDDSVAVRVDGSKAINKPIKQQQSQQEQTSTENLLLQKANQHASASNTIANNLRAIKNNTITTNPPGVFVLSMHRSGSSLLAGSLVKGLGYKSPGSKLEMDQFNARGYFENLHVVLQNDVWLQQYNLAWDSLDLHKYNAQETCIQSCPNDSLKNLKLVLLHYTLKRNMPFVMKDPRLCITLHNWFPAFSPKPAIVFTFRHPTQVATSLWHSQNISIAKGFQLYILYNRLAIENSNSACRIVTSNDAILNNPVEEMTRIQNELVSQCHLPPLQIKEAEIQNFVNVNLMHYKDDAEVAVARGSSPFQQEMYKLAMKVYKDMETNAAFQDGYKWPTIT